MTIIKVGDKMTDIMNNIINPVINHVNKYTDELVVPGQRYVVDSRKVSFSSSSGSYVGFHVEGMDPDEKIVRAVVKYHDTGVDIYRPCTMVEYDPTTETMTAVFDTPITSGDLFIEFWKKSNKETPAIELIEGKTEMRKVRSDILNPAMARIKELTQDVVHSGDKYLVDHRAWNNVFLTSISCVGTILLEEDEHMVRVMARSFDSTLNKAVYVPADHVQYNRETQRFSAVFKEVIGGRGNLYVEFWKKNNVVPAHGIPEISTGERLSNIRQLSVNQSITQMNAHTQQVIDMTGLKRNTIDYRSYDFDKSTGTEEGFYVHLDDNVYPVRSAAMVNGSNSPNDEECHACKTMFYDRTSHMLLADVGTHEKGRLFVEFWREL